MHFSRLDAFFHVASQGSHEAYQLLYNEFIYRAKIKVNQIADYSLKFTGFSEDFMQFIDELFFDALNNYESTKGSFTYFADYVLNLRLPPKVMTEMQKRNRAYQVRNEEGEDMDIEDFADPYQMTVSDEVEIEDFRQRISSPSRNISNEKRLQNKIAMMKYAGYKNIEIARSLNMDENTLRKHIKAIKRNEN